MKKYKDLQVVAIVVITFLVAFATSLLLELDLFRNLVRYILVCLLIIVELMIGVSIFIFKIKK
ncbi:hypothetical protein MHM83_10970 [Tenacibaculum sp. Mcav3-52]|uniref:hypothetical protein n=1 Tax=Tenacibaculum sp. Mcav3-52 TaxID=2917762 RepID=UPI001EF1FB95|nr:hypothetical protein [Tenacibaculum sp. Mcav3-52]MCG7502394.1 hypothetical protein [Tenacibaculum sp. Mcav3-52]